MLLSSLAFTLRPGLVWDARLMKPGVRYVSARKEDKLAPRKVFEDIFEIMNLDNELLPSIAMKTISSSFLTNVSVKSLHYGELGSQTSVVFRFIVRVELMTHDFSQYFLLLALIANIGKKISLACYLARWFMSVVLIKGFLYLLMDQHTDVHRSFVVADNLGEVSTKAQIQNA
ncbi:protein root UVB sensitive 4 [Tanacetum coccineum]